MFGAGFLYTAAAAVLPVALSLPSTTGRAAPGLTGITFFLFAMAAAAWFGTARFGGYLVSRGIGRPYLSAGLLSVAAVAPSLHALLAHAYFRFNWPAPTVEDVLAQSLGPLPTAGDVLALTAVLAVTAVLVVVVRRRYAVVLLVLVLTAGVGARPSMAWVVELREEREERERRLEWLQAIDTDLVVLDSQQWRPTGVIARPYPAERERPREPIRGYMIVYWPDEGISDLYPRIAEVTTWNSVADMAVVRHWGDAEDPLWAVCDSRAFAYECSEHTNSRGERVVIRCRPWDPGIRKCDVDVELGSGELVNVYARTGADTDDLLELVEALRWEEDGDREHLADEWGHHRP
ncbi:hypothetical protein [Nocardiopsis sp. NRRL B-16309]|uniref:hypothetical protein n=1 Tax=Nocardiopsis sp. NRRL B-16309 TaxID=1519494 RepID=UPI0006AFD79D|nr:hypothetical protein [Nocardiopsis sp. NRRL B-16309]